MSTARALAAAALLAAGVLLAPTAASAAPPGASATTGSAANITDSSAVLTGTVKPDGVAATYYFQYGLTAKYTTVTPVLPAGSGTAAVTVTAGIGALSADTKYHYRIVVLGAGGTHVGADHSFTTSPAPLAFQLTLTPNPIAYMGGATFAGVLSGTGSAGRAVVLQENPFPYAAGFVNVDNPELTNSNGSFSFPVGPLGVNTQFRAVVDGTNIASPVVTEVVAVGVSASVRVRRAGRGISFRVSGSVTPADTDLYIWLQKLVKGKWISTVRILPVVASPTTLTYSRAVRVQNGGSYRIYAQILDGSRLSSVSPVLTVRRPR